MATLKNCFFVLLFFFLSFQSAPASEYSGSDRDLDLIASIKSNAEKYISDRSILWIEKGYLSEHDAHVLQNKIDKAINDVEVFTNISFDENVYRKRKIEHFVHSKQEPSHTIIGNQPGKHMHPVIFLTYAAEKVTPYVHEIVHIIAWDWNSLWIKEGLAVYLNDNLNGYPAFPNYGNDIDKIAKLKLWHESALWKVGRNGIPEFLDQQERRIFYTLSGSFVKYLYTHIGIEKLMKIYKTKDTRLAVGEMTGQKLAMWKKEWIDYLNKHFKVP
jgi:hypothetical protein